METTSKKSLDTSQRIDGEEVLLWKDINIQASDKTNTTATAGTAPLYDKDGINGVPALLFGGVDEFIDTNYLFHQGATDGWSIFFVFENVGISGLRYMFGRSTGGAGEEVFFRTDSFNREFFLIRDSATSSNFNCCNSTINIGGKYIFSIIRSPYTGQRADYINSVSGGSNANRGAINSTSLSLYIGALNSNGTANTPGNIKVGEFIIFDRALSNFEREEIEKYLSKKWKIKLG